MTRSILIDGAPIQFEIRGSGLPILMLHGFAVDRRSIIGCMEPIFAQRPGWQRIYLDLPGMGETPAAAPGHRARRGLAREPCQGRCRRVHTLFRGAGPADLGTLPEILPGVRHADLHALAALSRQYGFADEPAQSFTRPVLLRTGRQDGDVGYRDAWNILESYPHASFAVLDRAGHNAEIEQDRLFEALIGEWLDRVADAAPRQTGPTAIGAAPR